MESTSQPDPHEHLLLSDEAILEELAGDLMDRLKSQEEEDRDPFELYAFRLKLRVYKDKTHFRERLVKGYHVLLENLA